MVIVAFQAIYNFIINHFDSQGSSQSRGISARAFALACPGGSKNGHFRH